MRFLSLGLMAAAIVSGVAWLEPARAQAAFVPTACAADRLGPEALARITCGRVTVPARYDAPDAGTFEIAVAVIRAESPEPGAEPVLILHGGPGAALLEAPQPWLNAPIGTGRDLILVDQRGGGASSPLICPGLADKHIDALAAELDAGKEQVRRRAADADCLRWLSATVYGPSAFGTPEVAQDMDQVRRALGIERWNVFGVSYGTAVAMTMMDMFPETIRSVILDSPYPPDPQPTSEVGNLAHSLDVLYASCRMDATCAERFPRLEPMFYEAVDALDRAPLVVPTGPSAAADGRVVVAGSDFLLLVQQLLYSRDVVTVLPLVIEAFHQRRADRLEPLVDLMFSRLRDFHFGPHLAIECRDRSRFRKGPALLPAGVAPQLGGFRFFDEHYAVCPTWGEPGAGPVLPVGSGIPTLVLSGTMDPATHPANAERVADALGNAQLVSLPGVGHGVMRSAGCAAQVTADFLEKPDMIVDPGCAATFPPLKFVTDVAYAPDISKGLQTAAAGRIPNRLAALFLLGAAALLLVVGWPLARIIGNWRHGRRGAVASAMHTSMAVLLTANGLVAAHAGLLVAAVAWTLVRQESVLVLGLPDITAYMAVLPWLAAGLAGWGAYRALGARRVWPWLAAVPPVSFFAVALSLGLAGI